MAESVRPKKSERHLKDKSFLRNLPRVRFHVGGGIPSPARNIAQARLRRGKRGPFQRNARADDSQGDLDSDELPFPFNAGNLLDDDFPRIIVTANKDSDL